MSSRHFWLCCLLLPLLVGCGAAVAPEPQGAGSGVDVAKPAAVSKPRAMVPRANQCGPKLDPKVWKIQCAKADLAMMCRRSDPTDRRCAYKLAGKYRWTYGSYCDRALPCYKRACR
ncbi:MAG: hypothetical protein ABR538_00140 [Candidatus Binatia bacterium]